MTSTQSGKRNQAGAPDRAALKQRLRELRQRREQAKEARESEALRRIRRQYRRVNHALRRLAPAKPKATRSE